MEKVIVDTDKLDVKVSVGGGKVKLEAVYASVEVGALAAVEVSVDSLLDQLKAKISGSIDDAVIDLLKAALKAV